MSTINDKILESKAEANPVVELQDGERVSLTSKLQFDQYISDSDFENYLVV
jgi:hypothetical protein